MPWAAGAEVTGVEPEFFISESFQMEGLTELIVTKDIPERRTKMIELGDAFIAFPGGTGTLEEVSEDDVEAGAEADRCPVCAV